MRTIGIRQFQQNFHKELKDMPILVTNHGAPVFQIIPVVDNVDNFQDLRLKETKEVVDNFPKCQISEAKTNVYCSDNSEAKYKITYYGLDEPAVWEIYLCKKHADINEEGVEVIKL